MISMFRGFSKGLLITPRASSWRLGVTSFPLVTTTYRCTMTTQITEEQLSSLRRYTACDVADALLKLSVPNAGYLPDLAQVSPATSSAGLKPSSNITIAPASTVLFAWKDASIDYKVTDSIESNIPSGKHWIDLTIPGTFVVMSQPPSQKCAVLGGIMALRAKVCGAVGIITHGRVRDIEELRGTGLLIWSRGRSIVGAGAESKPHAIQVPLDLDGTVVVPGDLVFSDSVNGIVIIPQGVVNDVLHMLPGLIEADNRVKEDVAKGMLVKEAFKKHRG